MAIINRIGDLQDEMTAWRRDLHAHPEVAFEERRTSAFVAEKLRSFGFDEVHTGIAKTGVVGVLKAGAGQGSIALRADMDALPIERDYRATLRLDACPARCTRAAMTATPRCCSAPPDISPRRATSTAPCTSSFSPPRRWTAAVA